MKGLKLDDKGDIVIEKGRIAMISDTDLIIQTVRQIIKTNLGEWEFDPDEGIDIQKLIAKDANYDIIRNTIQLGLRQVDESFVITWLNFQTDDRRLYIDFRAEASDGTQISISL